MVRKRFKRIRRSLLWNMERTTMELNLECCVCMCANFVSYYLSFVCVFPPTDLEWKVVYVGSAENSSHDQTLDEILVGPVPVGVNKFILQADAPDPASIPNSDVLGVTVILVTCSYREKEFVRVGYYVNNEYTEEFEEEKGPPSPLDMKKVMRTILADKPRVTRYV